MIFLDIVAALVTICDNVMWEDMESHKVGHQQRYCSLLSARCLVVAVGVAFRPSRLLSTAVGVCRWLWLESVF